MKLAKREKLLVSATAAIIGILLILYLIVIPFFDQKNKLARETETLENIIKEMDDLGIMGQDMAEISGGLDRVLAARKASLSDLVYSAAAAAGIKTQDIGRMTPREGKTQNEYQEDILEVKLNTITQLQLKQFLIGIEKPEKYIFVNRIKISKSRKEEGYLDIDIRIMSYKKVTPE